MAKRVLLPRVVQAHSVLLGQLKDRGFDVDDYANASVQEISAMLENKQLSMTVSSATGKKVHVIFHVTKSVRPPTIQEYVEETYDQSGTLNDDDELIIVAKDAPNDTIIGLLDKLWDEEKKYVVSRSLDSLQFNVLEHVLVPKHTVLSANEKASIMKKYNLLEDRQLPEIGRHDPVAIALGARPSNLLHIERPSRTAIVGNYYRLCV